MCVAIVEDFYGILIITIISVWSSKYMITCDIILYRDNFR